MPVSLSDSICISFDVGDMGGGSDALYLPWFHAIGQAVRVRYSRLVKDRVIVVRIDQVR